MSDCCNELERICRYCAAYRQSDDRGTNEGRCDNTPRWFRKIFGLRWVCWTNTCQHFGLHKRYGGRGQR